MNSLLKAVTTLGKKKYLRDVRECNICYAGIFLEIEEEIKSNKPALVTPGNKKLYVKPLMVYIFGRL